MRSQLIRIKGFTLIELLTVIAIIGILASFLVPAVNRARIAARLGKTQADLRSLADACDGYYAENGTYPPMGNDWVRIGYNGIATMGGANTQPGRFVSGNYVFYSNEDIGSDGVGPYEWNGTAWVVNVAYTGPDADGSEGNYRLDNNEDVGLDLLPLDPMDVDGDLDLTEPTAGEGNGRLDGTFYARIGAVESDVQRFGMVDELSTEGTQLYHYYAGSKDGPPAVSTVSVAAALAELQTSQPLYTAFVVYGIGFDESDHGLHNYYTTTMEYRDDLGQDNYLADPFDANANGVTFDKSDLVTYLACGPLGTDPCESDGNIVAPENDYGGAGVSPGDGRRIFDWDDRQLRLTTNEPQYAMPGAFPNGDGVMMVVRGG